MPVDIVRPARFLSTVVENCRLSGRYFLMVLSRPQGFPDPAPGSFLHMGIPARGRFFLRRPFSIFDCNKTTITLLLVEKGEGTRIIRGMNTGDSVDFLGPLGSAFPRFAAKKILAVAGGVGLGPLYYYPKYSALMDGGKGCQAGYRLVFGARTKEDLFLSRIDLTNGDTALATEDGSYGFEGNAVELAEDELKRTPADVLFSCGPTQMLKAVVDLANRYGISLWVSLENRMACGVGACRSCVIPIRPQEGSGMDPESPINYKTVCKDGPVFNAAEVFWERVPVP